MIEKQVDILVVGGGLTGAILMLALADKGYNSLLIDSHSFSDKVRADFDARTLALAPASIRILKMLNIWPFIEPDATAIEMIHVSEQHGFGSTQLHGQPLKPLGYVVEMQHINRALYQLLDKQQIMAPASLGTLNRKESIATINTSAGEIKVHAKLIVAADGSDSTVRRLSGLSAKTTQYAQQAIVANIGLARSHQNKAYERFTASGPLALLPMTEKRASLVWSLSPQEAKRLIAVDETAFLTALQQSFGYRLGRFVRAGQRVIFPLRRVTMTRKIAWPLVFVGNAAHTLHPVAGQGFNLGLRDVVTLAQCIIQQGLNDTMLARYEQMRQEDERAIRGLTDGLLHVFASRLPGMALARNLGLIAVDNLAFLNRYLTHYTCGFGGYIPDLVCGLPLQAGSDNEPVF
ncbi:FAD-dependent monooxygenase [Legionella fairfieldensis]|uniref:FAD-dependent monooxygenase n=1 Tax=Legionella fairfieldensis TaxID=45064 RepID=UPI00048D44A8|nr:FAD-dependent monooxygenase [Legionella fairfieldensis]